MPPAGRCAGDGRSGVRERGGMRPGARLAIDIDSTLHPYWDQLAEIALRRFDVELPYETQFTWAIDRLDPEQLRACVEETHSPEHVLKAEPYPGAVETMEDDSLTEARSASSRP